MLINNAPLWRCVYPAGGSIIFSDLHVEMLISYNICNGEHYFAGILNTARERATSPDPYDRPYGLILETDTSEQTLMHRWCNIK